VSAYSGQVPDTLDHGTDWLEHAVCKADPDAWFDNSAAGIKAAKDLCGRCPVRRACLIDVVRTEDVEWGVRAGFLPRERRAIVQEVARRRAAGKAAS
jgi:hypothetical protein